MKALIDDPGVLVCSSVMGVEDARKTFVKEREVGWYENLSRAD